MVLLLLLGDLVMYGPGGKIQPEQFERVPFGRCDDFVVFFVVVVVLFYTISWKSW